MPSYERPRLHGASNLSVISDGLRVLRCIASERFRSRQPRTDQTHAFPELSPALSS